MRHSISYGFFMGIYINKRLKGSNFSQQTPSSLNDPKKYQRNPVDGFGSQDNKHAPTHHTLTKRVFVILSAPLSITSHAHPLPNWLMAACLN